MGDRPRHTIDFSEYGRGLSKGGERAIGVHARRQRWYNVLLVLVAVALIAGAGALYVLFGTSRDRAVGEGQALVKVRCAACGYEGVAARAPGDEFPIQCPKCGRRALDELWHCHRCGTNFLLTRQPGDTIRCPNPTCRSTDVGAALAPGP